MRFETKKDQAIRQSGGIDYRPTSVESSSLILRSLADIDSKLEYMLGMAQDEADGDKRKSLMQTYRVLSINKDNIAKKLMALNDRF